MTSKAFHLAAALTALTALHGCCFGGTTDTGSGAAPVATAPADPAAAGSAGTQQASCDVTATLSTCRDMGPAAFALGEDLMRGLCTGTYTSGGACPSEGRVGSCDEGGGQVRRYYSSGPLPYTTESAQQDCQMMPGTTFTPG